MSTSFNVSIDLAAIEGLAAKLNGINPQSLGDGLVNTLNEVTDRAYVTTRNDMLRTINLSQEYVESKMTVNRAKTASNLSSSIVAIGPGRGKNAGAILGRYLPVMRTQPVRYPKLSKGDSSNQRNIPRGMKAAGVAVSVKRGSTKVIEHGFLMRLKNGNGIGVFTRSAGATGPKNVKHRYGPSVYQLFKVAADSYTNEIGSDLEKSIGDKALALFEEALK